MLKITLFGEIFNEEADCCCCCVFVELQRYFLGVDVLCVGGSGDFFKTFTPTCFIFCFMVLPYVSLIHFLNFVLCWCVACYDFLMFNVFSLLLMFYVWGVLGFWGF